MWLYSVQSETAEHCRNRLFGGHVVWSENPGVVATEGVWMATEYGRAMAAKVPLTGLSFGMEAQRSRHRLFLAVRPGRRTASLLP